MKRKYAPKQHKTYLKPVDSYIPNWVQGIGIAHYNDVIMGAITSQITSVTIVYSTVYSDADQRKHQSSALLAFVRGIHRWPVNSPHKCSVTRKMFLFDDVIIKFCNLCPIAVIECIDNQLYTTEFICTRPKFAVDQFIHCTFVMYTDVWKPFINAKG